MSESQTSADTPVNKSTPLSVRRRLTRDLIILVLLLSTAFLVLSWFYIRQVQKDITLTAIEAADISTHQKQSATVTQMG